jgi:hypothetical protein
MRAAFSEPAANDSSCEIRLGTASWDDGSGTAQSVKYTWFVKNGRAARGGEFPVEALPQALGFAIRKGYLQLSYESCRCRKTGHKHPSGPCGQPATEIDGYCKICHDEAGKEAIDAQPIYAGKT